MKPIKSALVLITCCVAVWTSVAPANATAAFSDAVWINSYTGDPFNPGTPSGVATEVTEGSPFDTGLFPSEVFNSSVALGFHEPNALSVLSDIAWQDVVTGHILIISDDNGAFTGVPFGQFIGGIIPIVETGLPQDISSFFGLSNNTLVVQSDVETTPLPAALPLFAGGLGVMGLIVRRRKRSAS